MKDMIISAALGLSISVFCAGVSETLTDYENITDNVFRLHIIANSDSEYDQQLKLAVRDELINRSPELFGDCHSRDEIISAAEDELEEIEETARETLKSYGCDSEVKAEITEMDFDTRYYGELTVPEGEYTALRVTIGEGNGHNWWCVMYPPLCLPCFTEEKETDEVLEGCEDIIPESSADMLKEPEKYEVRLYCVELLEKFIDFLIRE